MEAHGWFKEKLEEVQDSFEYKLETLELDVTERILKIMEDKSVTRAELARRMGVTKPTVTRLFRDGSNMTLKRMLSIAIALDCEVSDFMGEQRRVEKNKASSVRLAPPNLRFLGAEKTVYRLKNRSRHRPIAADSYYQIPKGNCHAENAS